MYGLIYNPNKNFPKTFDMAIKKIQNLMMISNLLQKYLQKNVSAKVRGPRTLHTKPKDENHIKIPTLFG
jgi:hypothetical protein